ncbi:hypothetical protein FM106_13840 [Brachybacterium faecium]|nr:hypothetical protein FM106_13840 [Brachybacterium faecium]
MAAFFIVKISFNRRCLSVVSKITKKHSNDAECFFYKKTS